MKITIEVTHGGGNPPGVVGMAPAWSREWIRVEVDAGDGPVTMGDERGFRSGWLGAEPRSTAMTRTDVAAGVGLIVEGISNDRTAAAGVAEMIAYGRRPE